MLCLFLSSRSWCNRFVSRTWYHPPLSHLLSIGSPFIQLLIYNWFPRINWLFQTSYAIYFLLIAVINVDMMSILQQIARTVIFRTVIRIIIHRVMRIHKCAYVSKGNFKEIARLSPTSRLKASRKVHWFTHYHHLFIISSIQSENEFKVVFISRCLLNLFWWILLKMFFSISFEESDSFEAKRILMWNSIVICCRIRTDSLSGRICTRETGGEDWPTGGPHTGENHIRALSLIRIVLPHLKWLEVSAVFNGMAVVNSWIAITKGERTEMRTLWWHQGKMLIAFVPQTNGNDSCGV